MVVGLLVFFFCLHIYIYITLSFLFSVFFLPSLILIFALLLTCSDTHVIHVFCVPLASESVYEYSLLGSYYGSLVGRTIDDWLVNNLGIERKQSEKYERLVGVES